MQDDPSETKSLERSLKTTLSLGDVLIEEGVKIVPGGELAYKLVKVLGQHARQFYQERTERRLEDFHGKILTGIPQQSQEDFLRRQFSLDDYYSILHRLVQDEENEKIGIYAKLFQSLVLQALPPDWKTTILKAARELSFSDFDLMRRIYVSDKFDLIGCSNKRSQIERFTKTNDPTMSASIENLIRLGFLSRQDPPMPTRTLRSSAEAVYDASQLTPESIGGKVQTIASERDTIIFVCDPLGDMNYFARITALRDALLREDILSRIAAPITAIGGYLTIVGVCIGTSGSTIENVKQFVSLDHKIVVQIILPGGEGQNIPIDNASVFNLSGTADPTYEISRFVDMAKKVISDAGLRRPLDRTS